MLALLPVPVACLHLLLLYFVSALCAQRCLAFFRRVPSSRVVASRSFCSFAMLRGRPLPVSGMEACACCRDRASAAWLLLLLAAAELLYSDNSCWSAQSLAWGAWLARASTSHRHSLRVLRCARDAAVLRARAARAQSALVWSVALEVWEAFFDCSG